MTYILANQRHSAKEIESNYKLYREYLAANRSRFPRQSYDLATAEWYYNAEDHRCPHDSWLDSVMINEPSSGLRNEDRSVAIRIRLLGAHHDGHIEFHYPQVFHYELSLNEGKHGHRDWLYDEFRLSETCHVIHEIEWAGPKNTGRWLIEASDVIYTWQPITT